LKYPRLGVSKCVVEIEKLFLREGWFHSTLYKVWLSLSTRDKTYVKNKIGRIICRYVLKDLWLAIARDILKEGGINTELEMYKYINRYVFYGNTRKMLVFLKDVLEKEVSK